MARLYEGPTASSASRPPVREAMAARQSLGDTTMAARPQLTEIINAHKHKAEKYRQCNAELSKSNAALNIRVRDLTADNIALRQQLLHLEVELNRRNQEQERNKEKLVSQLHQLLEEIEAPPPRVSQKNKKNRRSVDTDEEISPFLESRLLRGSYVPNEEFEMPVIQEEPGSRRSSVGGSTPGSDRRSRSSFSFDEINLPPPTTPSRVLQSAAHQLREEEEDQEEEYEEPVEEAPEEDVSNDRLEPSPEQSPASMADTNMLPRAVDTRPRRRRDSKIFTSYLPDPIPEPIKSDPISPPSPNAVEDVEFPETEEKEDEEEIIDSAQAQLQPKSTKPEPVPVSMPVKETVNVLEAPINPPAPAPRATKRKFSASESESPSISVDFNFQPQKPTSSKPATKKLAPIAPLSARKALSAKSTNHEPISPTKAASKAAGKGIDDLGKPGKSNLNSKLAGKVGLSSSNRVSGRGGKSILEDEPIVKPLLDSFLLESSHSARSTTSATPTPPPDEDTTARPSRRSKAVVSYAMPSLRAKMRREEGPDDAARKKKKKRVAGRRSSNTVGDNGEDWEGSQVSEATDLGNLGDLGEPGESGESANFKEHEDGDDIIASGGDQDAVLDINEVSLSALPETEIEEALAGIKRKRRTSASTTTATNEKETKRRQQDERRNSVAGTAQGKEKQTMGRRRSMMV
ncbi:hypothetical protein BZA77DRAFT_118989 [Pyronema omphalodes]|nr:hypothetical protein BZA77DRAFT_118989 [Pyronema omphalodes]